MEIDEVERYLKRIQTIKGQRKDAETDFLITCLERTEMEAARWLEVAEAKGLVATMHPHSAFVYKVRRNVVKMMSGRRYDTI